MKDYNDSSAQAEMDAAELSCMSKALDDSVYAARLDMANFVEPRIVAPDGRLVTRTGEIVWDSEKSEYVLWKHGDFPEMTLSLYRFKVVPSAKNVGHDCYDKEITVPGTSVENARETLDFYLGNLYRCHDIDGSWFTVVDLNK